MAACKCAKVRDIQKVPNLNLVLNTRTRDLMAETWDLKVFRRSPVSLERNKSQLQRIKVISTGCVPEHERAQFAHPTPP